MHADAIVPCRIRAKAQSSSFFAFFRPFSQCAAPLPSRLSYVSNHICAQAKRSKKQLFFTYARFFRRFFTNFPVSTYDRSRTRRNRPKNDLFRTPSSVLCPFGHINRAAKNTPPQPHAEMFSNAHPENAYLARRRPCITKTANEPPKIRRPKRNRKANRIARKKRVLLSPRFHYSTLRK